jgi:hypothetical protein
MSNRAYICIVKSTISHVCTVFDNLLIR